MEDYLPVSKDSLMKYTETDQAKIQEIRQRIYQENISKSISSVRIMNFVLTNDDRICCFFGKTLFITDCKYIPILYYKSTSYLCSCSISAHGKYAVCQMARNDFSDEDSNATVIFDVDSGRIIARRVIETDWRGVTHIYVDEEALCVWIYYETERVQYDFSLQPNEKHLSAYFLHEKISPYSINSRIWTLLNKIPDSETGTNEKTVAMLLKEVEKLLERITNPLSITPYQISQTYGKLGDVYSKLKMPQKAVMAYENGLSANPKLPVKRKLKAEKAKIQP